MFNDRQDAGRQLAAELLPFKGEQVIVLALPRGGVPVAAEIAQTLNAPLDVLVVKKIGAPSQPELAIGAVSDGDDPLVVIDEEVASFVGASKTYIEGETVRKLEEISNKQQLYTQARPSKTTKNTALTVKGKTVILVDDGIATGATVKVALKSLRARGAKRLILAVPLAPQETIDKLKTYADQIICLSSPDPFYAISPHYRYFGQVSDGEVVEILAHHQ